MTIINGINGYTNSPANYNAVKIKIDEPVTNIPEGFKPSSNDRGIYNAVDLEITRPAINVYKEPVTNSITADSSYTYPINGLNMNLSKMPMLPVAYMTNYIHNRTLVNAEFDYDNENAVANTNSEENMPEVVEITEIVEFTEVPEEEPEVEVPAPNYTTIEAEKMASEIEPAFHGLNFRANKRADNIKPVEIVPSVEIKPEIDLAKVTANLSNSDFDIQALQMEEIAKAVIETPEKAEDYISTEVFTELINIINLDSTKLTAPSAEQNEIRKMYIINQLVKADAEERGEDPNKVELPYNLTEKQIIEAANLTTMEQAERNKEYALYVIAILDKLFIENTKEKFGNVIALTDLPGIAEVVSTLRTSSNAPVKIAAIDALRYIYRPEYNDEIKSVLSIAAKDSDEIVARNALLALIEISDKNSKSE